MNDLIYKIDNEIIALILAAFAVYYLNKILLKEMAILKAVKRVFAASIAFCMAEIFITLMENLPTSNIESMLIIAKIAVIVRILLKIVVTVQWLYLMLLYSERTKEISKRKHMIIWAPFGLVVLMTCFNPFIDLVYTSSAVNGKLVLEFGILNTLVDVIVALYYVYMAIYIYGKKQHLSRSDIKLFVWLLITYIIMILIQGTIEGWLIKIPITIFCMFVCLARLKDEFMRLNLEDGTLKRSMLEYFFNKNLQNGKKDLAIAYLILKDSQYIENKFGKKEKNKYELDFIKILGENELYEVSGYGYGRIVLYLKTNNREVIRKILEEIECRVNIFNNKDFKDRKYTINYECAVAVYDDKYDNCKDVIEAAYKDVYLKVYGGEQ